MNYNKSSILLLCFVILFGCKARNSEKNQNKVPAEAKGNISGNFLISGAYALYPLVRKWADDFMKIQPAVKIMVVSGGTGQGITDLLAKKNQLAMVSRPLTDEELNAGIWSVPVAKDGVAPIINQKNPYLERILNQGLSPEEYMKAFTSDKPLTWGELLDTIGKEKIIVFTRADESGAADVFADFLFKKSSDLKGTRVTGDEEMIKSVQENKLALGFCNFSYAFDAKTGERIKNIQIVPSDLDFDNKIDREEIPFTNLEEAHRGLWLGIYPKNLCRELTISSLEKPVDPAIIEFLRYMLTEGQESIKETGLCALNNVYLRSSLEKLK
ncbi:MAG: substrate-binding domain-containing protein [Bacteroidia bacterium]|nr:substrate-binding domain-containing protein [Bacteroidia bacterium]